MMVCGCVASSDALAGATSGLKAVPVTTTVSTLVGAAAAICWATCCACASAASIAPVASAKAAVERRKILADIINNPSKSNDMRGQANPSARPHIFANARLQKLRLAIPVFADANDTEQ